MKDWTLIQERYLRDAIPVRLGGLALDLSRIKSTAPNEANQSIEQKHRKCGLCFVTRDSGFLKHLH